MKEKISKIVKLLTTGLLLGVLFLAAGAKKADAAVVNQYELLQKPFEDINRSGYYYNAVLWAYENGITTGKDATHFNPAGLCNRAQVVTFLWCTFGEPEPKTTENPFVDIKEHNYYYKAVLWAYENDITTGKDATHFEPLTTVTRAQVVTFLWRAEKKPEPVLGNPFNDIGAGVYYEKAVCWAYENGITTGKDSSHFQPMGECIRSQIVTFLYRAYGGPSEDVVYDDAYKKLIEETLYPKLGLASKSFDPWKKLSYGQMFGKVDETHMGLVSAMEYDCNFDQTTELLVFYLKQEEQIVYGGDKLTTQKLYIDLYTQTQGNAVRIGTIDTIELVYPWSSCFAAYDSLRAAIKSYNDHTYLYIYTGSANEGPAQTAVYVYDLTNVNSIQSTTYYSIIDADRLNGKLMIPANVNGGSSGEHEFIAKVANGQTELFYETYDGKRYNTSDSMKCKSMEEAEQRIIDELLAVGININVFDEELTEILSWHYEKDEISWINIYDKTFLQTYIESLETEEELLNSLYGTWTIDGEKFSDVNGISLKLAFGSPSKDNKMIFTEEGEFSYSIPLELGGKGSFSLLGDWIHADIMYYESEEPSELILKVVEEDGKTYIRMEVDCYQIHWCKS